MFPVHIHVGAGGNNLFPPNMFAPGSIADFRLSQHRRGHDHSGRISRDDPVHVVGFEPMPTTVRWQEEAKILFAGSAIEKAARVIPSILRLIVYPARKAQREKEEADLKQRRKEEEEANIKAAEEAEKREREEREAREQKEREEQVAAEVAAVAAEVAATQVQVDQVPSDDAEADLIGRCRSN